MTDGFSAGVTLLKLLGKLLPLNTEESKTSTKRYNSLFTPLEICEKFWPLWINVSKGLKSTASIGLCEGWLNFISNGDYRFLNWVTYNFQLVLKLVCVLPHLLYYHPLFWWRRSLFWVGIFRGYAYVTLNCTIQQKDIPMFSDTLARG